MLKFPTLCLVVISWSVSTADHGHLTPVTSLAPHPQPLNRQPRDVPVSSYTRFGTFGPKQLPAGAKPLVTGLGNSQEYYKYDGSFAFGYKLPNGISVNTKGSQKGDGQVMEGEYSYTSPEGVPIVTKWFADETGFHLIG